MQLMSVARVKFGNTQVNITVRAPPGGEYDVDVKAVKRKYNWWRWRIMSFRIVCLILLSIWTLKTLMMKTAIVFSPEPPFNSVYFQAFVDALYNLFFTAPGWIALAGFLVLWVWIKKVNKNKAHFECPFGNCREEIRIYEPWECQNCRDDKETTPGLFHFGTFFDKCKKKHKPESYLCPSCRDVFKLIPNGRTDKPAKCPERLLPSRNVVLMAAAQPPRQELMPRDDRFF
jgi:hypothetical protein